MNKLKTKISREMEQLKDLGKRFAGERRTNDMNYQQLAEASGVTTMTLANLENGRLSNSSLRTLNMIAEGLGLEIEIRVRKK